MMDTKTLLRGTKIKNKGSERPRAECLIMSPQQPVNKVIHNYTSVLILLGKRRRKHPKVLERNFQVLKSINEKEAAQAYPNKIFHW